MIIDTDVLIWYMRGNTKAYRVIHRQRHGFSLSVVTYIELVQGMRNKRELNEFKKALRSWKASVLPVNEAISDKAKYYIEQYYLSHSLQLADALVAGTAVIHNLPILTGNDKHYRMIPVIRLQKFSPL